MIWLKTCLAKENKSKFYKRLLTLSPMMMWRSIGKEEGLRQLFQNMTPTIRRPSLTVPTDRQDTSLKTSRLNSLCDHFSLWLTHRKTQKSKQSQEFGTQFGEAGKFKRPWTLDASEAARHQLRIKLFVSLLSLIVGVLSWNEKWVGTQKPFLQKTDLCWLSLQHHTPHTNTALIHCPNAATYICKAHTQCDDQCCGTLRAT